ncbi:hypothetical protein ACTFIY_008642 [Dictyostelium cf. discoideum]
MTFENGSIPNSVTDLRLPTNFNENLLNDDCTGGSGSDGGSGGIYPNNLKRLCLKYSAWGEDSFFCSKYKRSKMKSYISTPKTLEFLKIQYLNFPFKECEFKISKFSSIHTLELSSCFDGSMGGTLKADIFPPSLTKLALSCNFKYIENNAFSKTKIKELIFLIGFDYSMTFPYQKIKNEAKLKIFETDSLPNGLKQFIAFNIYEFNQNIKVNNFFPVSCTSIYLSHFKRSITTKLKDGTVVSIFPENLKELVFYGMMLYQPLLLLPNSINTLKIIGIQCTEPFMFNQPLIEFNCLPLFLINLELNYQTYYLKIIYGVIEKIKWLPITLTNLIFYNNNIKTIQFAGDLNYYKSQTTQSFSNCPFDNFYIISNLKYLQISEVYYKD